MLQLVSYNEEHFEALNYKLFPEQAKFTSSIDQCKEDEVFSDFQKSVITIMYNDEPIGFFILDKGNDKFNVDLNTRKILVKQTVKVYNELRPHLSNHYLTPMQMHQQEELIPKSYKKKNSTNKNICTV